MDCLAPADVAITRALMAISAQHADPDARAATHDALAGVSLSGAQLAPLLAALEDESPAVVKRRRGASTATADAPADKGAAVDVLEMLQWRSGVEEPSVLVAPLQGIVKRYVAVLQQQDAMHTYALVSFVCVPPIHHACIVHHPYHHSNVSTCFQLALALSALHNVLQACDTANDVDVALAVAAAQATDDGAVRAAALRLVTLLATRAPTETLAHVLQVRGSRGSARVHHARRRHNTRTPVDHRVDHIARQCTMKQVLAVVTDSSAVVHDHALVALLPATLAAVASAWLTGGRPAQQLVTALLEQLDAVPAHRQQLLLQSLADALPEVCRLSQSHGRVC